MTIDAQEQTTEQVYRVKNKIKLAYFGMLIAGPTACYNIAAGFGSDRPLPADHPVVLISVGIGILLTSVMMIECLVKQVTLKNGRLTYRALRGGTSLPLRSLRYAELRGSDRASIAVIGGPTGSVALSGMEFGGEELAQLVGEIHRRAAAEGIHISDESPQANTTITKLTGYIMKFAAIPSWRLALIVILGIILWTELSGRMD